MSKIIELVTESISDSQQNLFHSDKDYFKMIIMTKKKIFIVFFILATLLPANALAEIKTFTYTVKQTFSKNQSPADVRIAAIHQSKREVLELAGTYLESMSIVKNNVLEKDEILVLSAGVLSAEIIGVPKSYAEGDIQGLEITTKVIIDTSILEKKIEKFLNDRTLLEKYRESMDREKELLEKIKSLAEQNKRLAKTASEEQLLTLRIEYTKAVKGLSAIELNNKAFALWRHGSFSDVNKAIDYLNQTIQIDPDFSSAYNNLALAYYHKGNYAQSAYYAQKALDIGLKKYGTEHLNTAAAYNNIGLAYKEMGKYDQAIECFQVVLAISMKLRGPESVEVATAYNNLGWTYNSKSDFDLAIEYHKKAIPIDLKAYGPRHPIVARDYNNIGLAYKGIENYDQAMDYYKKAMDISNKRLPPDDPSIARLYNNMGVVYAMQGEYAEAIEYISKALDIDLKKFGPKHPLIANRYQNLGAIYQKKGDLETARIYFKRAKQIKE